jgi:hypothetical protein
LSTIRALPSALFLAVFVLSAAGCSVSYSSKSSSDSVGSLSNSVSSPSESSSPKDGIGKEKIPYRDDVANLTYSVSATSMPPEDFPVALARTAQQFKITDWAQEKATYYGIGKGLKKAGIPKEKIGSQTFLQQVLTYNKDALKYIEEGYRY